MNIIIRSILKKIDVADFNRNRNYLYAAYIATIVIISMQVSCSNSSTEANDSTNTNKPYFSPPPQINVSQLVDSLATFKKYTGSMEMCSADTLTKPGMTHSDDAALLGGGFHSRQQQFRYSAVNTLDVRRLIGNNYSTAFHGQIQDDNDYRIICNQTFSGNYSTDQNTRSDSLYLRLLRIVIPQFDSSSFNYVRLDKIVLDPVYLLSGDFTPNAKCLYEDSAVASFERNYGNSYIAQAQPCAIFIHILSIRCQTNLGNQYLNYKMAFDQLCESLLGIDTSAQDGPLVLELSKNGIRSLTLSTLASLNGCEIITERKNFQDRLGQFSSYYDEQIKNGTYEEVHIEKFRIQPYYDLLGASGIYSAAYFPSFP